MSLRYEPASEALHPRAIKEYHYILEHAGTSTFSSSVLLLRLTQKSMSLTREPSWAPLGISAK